VRDTAFQKLLKCLQRNHSPFSTPTREVQEIASWVEYEIFKNCSLKATYWNSVVRRAKDIDAQTGAGQPVAMPAQPKLNNNSANLSPEQPTSSNSTNSIDNDELDDRSKRIKFYRPSLTASSFVCARSLTSSSPQAKLDKAFKPPAIKLPSSSLTKNFFAVAAEKVAIGAKLLGKDQLRGEYNAACSELNKKRKREDS